VEVDRPPGATIWENDDSDDKKLSNGSALLKIVFVGSSVAITLILLLLTLLFYLRKKKQNIKEKLDNIEAGEKLMEPQNITDDNWEVPDQVVLGQELGKNRFRTLTYNFMKVSAIIV